MGPVAWALQGHWRLLPLAAVSPVALLLLLAELWPPLLRESPSWLLTRPPPLGGEQACSEALQVRAPHNMDYPPTRRP